MSNNDVVPTVPDPFAEDLFAPLDTRGDGGSLTEELERIAAETAEAPPVTSEPPVAEAPPVAPTADEPKVYEFEDGSTALVEKGSRGWKATLDPNTGGGTEVFYGATKDELLLNVLAGKINATQKIRELNRTIKLGTVDPERPASPVAVAPEEHVLTADEIFEIKTKLATSPDLAFERWFQLRTGLSVTELVKLAKLGKSASDELIAEAVSKEFLARHEDYIPYEKNFETIIAWLCKEKLGQALKGRDPNSMIEVLYNKGYWTGEVLDEAYKDLVADGLLDLHPEEAPATAVEDAPNPEPKTTPEKPVVVESPVKPAASNERIVREVRRPRAGLGIRSREASASPPDSSERPPSDEELDNLGDEAVDALFAGVRKLKLGTRR